MSLKEGYQNGFRKIHELSSPLTKESIDWPFMLNLIKFWLSEKNKHYVIGHEIGILVGFIANYSKIIKKDIKNIETEYTSKTK